MTESIENSLSRQYTFKVLRTDECKKMAHNHTPTESNLSRGCVSSCMSAAAKVQLKFQKSK